MTIAATPEDGTRLRKRRIRTSLRKRRIGTSLRKIRIGTCLWKRRIGTSPRKRRLGTSLRKRRIGTRPRKRRIWTCLWKIRIYLKQGLDVVNGLVVCVDVALVVVHIPGVCSKSTHTRLFVLHVLKVITANRTHAILLLLAQYLSSRINYKLWLFKSTENSKLLCRWCTMQLETVLLM